MLNQNSVDKGVITMINKKEEIKDVQPIRPIEKNWGYEMVPKRHCSERDYILFLLGINTGLGKVIY